MKVWKDKDYFRRKDDNRFCPPDWVTNVFIVALIAIAVIACIELIDSRKQLQAIETAVRDCQQLNTRHLIIQPVQGCEKTRTAIIQYKGE